MPLLDAFFMLGRFRLMQDFIRGAQFVKRQTGWGETRVV